MKQALDNLEKYLHAPSPAVQSDPTWRWCTRSFETIHPFLWMATAGSDDCW